MSRRAPPAQDRTEANRSTLKSLVKLPSNRICADCKTQKHPRWASWSLGIFICIRCSGIHRGMGTHISRVKSVDLDSWTDEQVANMLRWGNRRANRYWEFKLNQKDGDGGGIGHVPREEKIENFIRTKYESKRWVMDGPMPDPETLGGEEDDDVPLNIVQEKAKLGRSASQKIQSTPARAASASTSAQRTQPNVDLFADEPPARPSTGPPMNIATAPPPKAPADPPKQAKPADSLLGLDFFGDSTTSPPARPSSTTGNPTATQRTDLKQSILSLYASAPKTAPKPQQHQRQSSSSLGGQQSPSLQSARQQSSGLGSLNDAFSGLTFSSTSTTTAAQTQQQRKPSSPFDNLAGLANPKAAPAPAQTTTSFGGGGSFFDPAPAKLPAATQASVTQPAPPQRGLSSSSGFGDFLSSTSPIAPTTTMSPIATNQSNANQDLFGLLDSPPKPTSKPAASPQPSANSAFNLSNPLPSPQPTTQQTPASKPATNAFASLSSNFDPWASTEAWGAESKDINTNTTSTTTTTQPALASPAASSSSKLAAGGLGGLGWAGSSSSAGVGGALGMGTGKALSPEITKDDDFGGWSSAPAGTGSGGGGGGGTGNGNGKTKAFVSNDDLFSNVWE